ncbi:MAG TPA: glycosyl transferase family protein [Allosphingosinicella sp.]|jgi:adsorption protein B
MGLGEALLAAAEFAMRETALFAAVGFLLLGISDLAVDLVWIVCSSWRLLSGRGNGLSADQLPPPERPGRLAVFTPAWDEAAVIRDMLQHSLGSFEHDDYRIYVGCYPNDPATVREVRRVQDPRVRLVIGPIAGPTTKADCLNRLWEAMLADEEQEGSRFKAVVLHDAEDVVHSAELRIFDRLIERYDLVQLPVVPMIDPDSRWISAHYADEFAESHAKELVVRGQIGAGIPSAGVGCAFSREALGRIAARQGGLPFDADSLTEDYELGLKLRDAGGSRAFVRIAETRGGEAVATREYFPATIEAAVNQKARWMAGIALSGWDRLGWAGGLAERWMRVRDRQSVLAAALLLAGYVSFGFWTLLKVPEMLTGWAPASISDALETVLLINLAMLVWRLAMRVGFVTRAYGWREGFRSIPRVAVSNAIAMLAAWRAIARYRSLRKGGPTKWEKTAHSFPAGLAAQ